jgi:hypothetical protein
MSVPEVFRGDRRQQGGELLVAQRIEMTIVDERGVINIDRVRFDVLDGTTREFFEVEVIGD